MDQTDIKAAAALPAGLTFEAASHTYRLNGRTVPGVTEILGDVLGDQWAGIAGAYHQARGQAAHAVYALLARGNSLADYTVDPVLVPYARQWLSWRDTVRPTPSAIEAVVYSTRHDYAGTADLLAWIGGKLAVIDFKGTATARDRLQLAAYAIAAEECGLGRVATLLAVEIGPESWRMIDAGRAVGTVLPVSIVREAKADWLAVRTVYRLRHTQHRPVA